MMFRMNVVSTLRTARALLPLLRLTKGRLVTVGLTGECCGTDGSGAVAYSAARHAVAGASAALRHELSPTPVSVVVADVPRVRAEALYRPVKPRKDDADSLSNYRSDTLPPYLLSGLEEVLLCTVPKDHYELRPPVSLASVFRVRRKSVPINSTV